MELSLECFCVREGEIEREGESSRVCLAEGRDTQIWGTEWGEKLQKFRTCVCVCVCFLLDSFAADLERIGLGSWRLLV